MFDSVFTWLLDSFNGNNLMRQFVAFTIVVVIVLITLSFLQNFFSLFRKKKRVIVKTLSDAEMAYQEFGPLPKGSTVYVFDIVTGKLELTSKERFYSSRELNYSKYKQIAAFSEAHASELFKNWKIEIYEG